MASNPIPDWATPGHKVLVDNSAYGGGGYITKITRVTKSSVFTEPSMKGGPERRWVPVRWQEREHVLEAYGQRDSWHRTYAYDVDSDQAKDKLDQVRQQNEMARLNALWNKFRKDLTAADAYTLATALETYAQGKEVRDAAAGK